MMELVLGFDHAGHAAPHVDGRDGTFVEKEDRASGRTFVVFGESDTQAGKVNLEAWGGKTGYRNGSVSAGHVPVSFAPGVRGGGGPGRRMNHPSKQHRPINNSPRNCVGQSTGYL